MTLPIPGYEFFTNGMAVDHEEPKKQYAGNAFTGSVGTHTQTGFLGSTSFNYSILLKKDLEGKISFIVKINTRPPYSPQTTCYIENEEEKTFDGTEEMLEEIDVWLCSKCRSFGVAI